MNDTPIEQGLDIGLRKPNDNKALAMIRQRLRRHAVGGRKTGRPALSEMTVDEIIAEGKIPITQKQGKFVRYLASGMTGTQAAKQSGYADPAPDAVRLLKNNAVLAALKLERMSLVKAAAMTRKKVLDGFAEAVEMAKLQGDPAVMVMAWREIGRMCGFYEAIKHEHTLTVQGEVTHKAIRGMSDEELLRLADSADATSRVLEGEFAALPAPQAEVPENADAEA